MTNIESRPYPGRPWEYYFHMDITGHLTDPAVQEACSSCRRIPRNARFWGTTRRTMERKRDYEIGIIGTGFGLASARKFIQKFSRHRNFSTYDLVELEPEQVGPFLTQETPAYNGCNVTIPYKRNGLCRILQRNQPGGGKDWSLQYPFLYRWGSKRL